MDCYFLKIKITEFIYKSNEESKYILYECQKNQIKKENKEEKYEIQFELKKSNEKYILEIINDEKGNRIPLSNYFTLITKININKNEKENKENIKYDYLEILLYSKNKEKDDLRKLIDIDQGKLIDENCINNNKSSILNLGNFFIKYTYKLTKLEDLYDLETKETENEIINKDNLFQEIEPVIQEKENNDRNSGIFHTMNSKDFFDINVDILEEYENEEEENTYSNSYTYSYSEKEKEEKNPFEPAYKYKKNFSKIFRNSILSTYELIHLEKPELKEIFEENIIECFLASGLSKTKKIINKSESYKPQCNHKNCELFPSYNSEVFFRIQKSKSIFEEIDSNLITNLIFPSGIKICFEQNILINNLIKKRKSLQFRKADYSFNVLTDLQGNRYYIYSIIFFIKFELKEFFEFYNEYIDIKDLNKNNIFVPFSFSIISKFFDINKFNIILNDLYISFNTNELNTENFDKELIHLLYEIPIPPINSKFNGSG